MGKSPLDDVFLREHLDQYKNSLKTLLLCTLHQEHKNGYHLFYINTGQRNGFLPRI
jgi:hypothetical protein